MGFDVSIPEGAYYVLADHRRFGLPDDRAFVEHLIRNIGVAAIPPIVLLSRIGRGQAPDPLCVLQGGSGARGRAREDAGPEGVTGGSVWIPRYLPESVRRQPLTVEPPLPPCGCKRVTPRPRRTRSTDTPEPSADTPVCSSNFGTRLRRGSPPCQGRGSDEDRAGTRPCWRHAWAEALSLTISAAMAAATFGAAKEVPLQIAHPAKRSTSTSPALGRGTVMSKEGRVDVDARCAGVDPGAVVREPCLRRAIERTDCDHIREGGRPRFPARVVVAGGRHHHRAVRDQPVDHLRDEGRRRVVLGVAAQRQVQDVEFLPVVGQALRPLPRCRRRCRTRRHRRSS